MATPGQVQRMRAYFADVPQDQRLDCFRETANVLRTAINQQALPANATLKDCQEALASFWPPANTPNKLSGLTLETAEGALRIYVPREIRSNPQQAVGAAGMAINVDTAETVERREKWLTVAGMKWPRRSETPWTFLYPHHWVELMLKTDGTDPSCIEVAAAHDQWLRQLQNATTLNGAHVAEIHIFKWRKLLSSMEQLFVLCPKRVPIEQIPPAFLRLWFNTVEMLLEVFLLSVRCSSNSATVTAKFATFCEARWHSGDGLDYFKALTEAREAKDSNSRPPPPAAQNTPNPKNASLFFRRR